MKKIILSLMAITLTVVTFAQEKKDRVEVTANLQSNHLWRGLVIADKPVITAQTIFNLDKEGKFTAGIWGGMGISEENDRTHYKEIDYYIQYADKGFSIGLWNLYNTRSATGDKANIWNYKSETTGHLLDLRTSYYFGDETPLTLEADFLLYGANDARMEGADVVQKYSTYLQLSYNFVGNSVNVKPFLGAGFALNGDKDSKLYDIYGSSDKNFEIVNVGFTASKTIKISESYSLPASVTTMWNPAQKFARVQLSTTLF